MRFRRVGNGESIRRRWTRGGGDSGPPPAVRRRKPKDSGTGPPLTGKTKTRLKLGTYNIRGALDRKLSALAWDVTNRGLIVLGLQETRQFPPVTTDSRTENNHRLIIGGGPSATKRCDHGVAALIHRDYEKFLTHYRCHSDRVLHLRFDGLLGHGRGLHVLIGYAPTEEVSKDKPAKRSRYYEQLTDAIAKCKSYDEVVVLTDANGRMGSRLPRLTRDNPLGSQVTGKYAGQCRTTPNGEVLRDFCVTHSLVAANTCFQHKMAHRTTWSKMCFGRTLVRIQIDYVLIRSSIWSHCTNARSYGGFRADSDHRAVVATIDFFPYPSRPPAAYEMAQSARPIGRATAETAAKFTAALKAGLQHGGTAEQQYSAGVATITKIAAATLGFRPRPSRIRPVRDAELARLSAEQHTLQTRYKSDNLTMGFERRLRTKRSRLLREIRARRRRLDDKRHRKLADDAYRAVGFHHKYRECMRELMGMWRRQRPAPIRLADENSMVIIDEATNARRFLRHFRGGFYDDTVGDLFTPGNASRPGGADDDDGFDSDDIKHDDDADGNEDEFRRLDDRSDEDVPDDDDDDDDDEAQWLTPDDADDEDDEDEDDDDDDDDSDDDDDDAPAPSHAQGCRYCGRTHRVGKPHMEFLSRGLKMHEALCPMRPQKSDGSGGDDDGNEDEVRRLDDQSAEDVPDGNDDGDPDLDDQSDEDADHDARDCDDDGCDDGDDDLGLDLDLDDSGDDDDGDDDDDGYDDGASDSDGSQSTASAQTPPAAEEQPITDDEVGHAISRARSGTAPGQNGITIDTLKAGGEPVIRWLGNICRAVQRGDTIPRAMMQGELRPLRKPGKPLYKEASHRPIMLLDVCRRVLESVLNARCKTHVDLGIAHTQAGFRGGHSTAEGVFISRLLSELACVNQDFTYHIALLDFSKAFDKVDRQKALDAMAQLGMDTTTASRMLSGTEFCVRLGKTTTEFARTNVGVVQGGSLSPTMYITFQEIIFRRIRPAIDDLRRRYPEATILVTVYADDVIVHTWSETDKQLPAKLSHEIISISEREFARDDQHLNPAKTEHHEPCKDIARVVGERPRVEGPWKTAKCLGSMLDSQKDWLNRRDLANKAFPTVRWYTLRRAHALHRFNTYILPIAVHLCGLWTCTMTANKSIDSWHMGRIRLALNYRSKRRREITNVELRRQWKIPLLSAIVRKRRWDWIGHVLRHPDQPAYQILALCRERMEPRLKDQKKRRPENIHCRRYKGSVRKTWLDVVNEEIWAFGTSWTELEAFASKFSTEEWKTKISEAVRDDSLVLRHMAPDIHDGERDKTENEIRKRAPPRNPHGRVTRASARQKNRFGIGR